jgi:hypothetical protein
MRVARVFLRRAIWVDPRPQISGTPMSIRGAGRTAKSIAVKPSMGADTIPLPLGTSMRPFDRPAPVYSSTLPAKDATAHGANSMKRKHAATRRLCIGDFCFLYGTVSPLQIQHRLLRGGTVLRKGVKSRDIRSTWLPHSGKASDAPPYTGIIDFRLVCRSGRAAFRFSPIQLHLCRYTVADVPTLHLAFC